MPVMAKYWRRPASRLVLAAVLAAAFVGTAGAAAAVGNPVSPTS
jgi:hypothetical protein